MKTNLLVIFLAAIFAISLNVKAHAQDSVFGVKGGAALYTMTGSLSFEGESIEEKSDARIGFAAGIFIERPFSDLLSGQIEALYVQKGAKDNVEEADLDDGNLTLSFVDVPVMLKVKVPVEGDIEPFVYGGGFAGYLLDASAEAGGQSAEDEGIEIKDLMTDINYGLIFGAGASFGSITIDVRYDLGLANLFDKESDLIQDIVDEVGGEDDEVQAILDGVEFKTSGFQFTLGVSF